MPKVCDSFIVIPGGCRVNKISKDFSGTTGGIISGWAAFDAKDSLFYNDAAVVKVLQGNQVLFFSDISIVGSNGSTPWTAFSFTFPSDGTVTLEASSTNKFDCLYPSNLLIDGVKYV